MVDKSPFPPPEPGRGWTVDDLDKMPGDELRYELFDGMLVVSPAPVPLHQRTVTRLVVLLDVTAGDDLQVYPGLDFRPTKRRSFQPDVLVVGRDDPGDKYLTVPPRLVVEVLSDSTRSTDLLLKRAFYESSGVPAYWIVDPKVPSLTVLELRDGRYTEAASVVGDRRAALELPFPVTVCPAELVRR